MSDFISETAVLKNTDISNSVKIYHHCDIRDSFLGHQTAIGDDTVIISSFFESNCAINRRNFIQDSKVGRYTYTGQNTTIRAASIGRFCSISWNVSIGGKDHATDYVSNGSIWAFHNMDGNKPLGKFEYSENQPDCQISNDVWIATNAVILRNVKIGDGAVIGAGAIVTRDVDPYTIVAGVPAKPIRKRFNDQISAALQEIQWWNWPADVIRKNIDIIYKKKVDMSVIEQLMAIKKGIE